MLTVELVAELDLKLLKLVGNSPASVVLPGAFDCLQLSAEDEDFEEQQVDSKIVLAVEYTWLSQVGVFFLLPSRALTEAG